MAELKSEELLASLPQDAVSATAVRVIENTTFKEDGTSKFDFLSITMLIIEILSTLIPLLRDRCKKDPDEVEGLSREPGLLGRAILRRHIINSAGRGVWREHGAELMEGILRTGAEGSPAVISNLYEEID